MRLHHYGRILYAHWHFRSIMEQLFSSSLNIEKEAAMRLDCSG